jgi:hypothetical protein
MMVMDGDKAQTEGELRRKMRDAGCHIKKHIMQNISINWIEVKVNTTGWFNTYNKKGVIIKKNKVWGLSQSYLIMQTRFT